MNLYLIMLFVGQVYVENYFIDKSLLRNWRYLSKEDFVIGLWGVLEISLLLLNLNSGVFLVG
jgi:hypothetical protein